MKRPDLTYLSVGCSLDISSGAAECVLGYLSLEFNVDSWAGDVGNGALSLFISSILFCFSNLLFCFVYN